MATVFIKPNELNKQTEKTTFCRSLDDARLLLEAPDLLGPCETSMQGKVKSFIEHPYAQF